MSIIDWWLNGSRARQRRWRTLRWAVAGAALALAVGNAPSGSVSTSRTYAAGDPVIAAAGDIACDPTSGNFNGGAGSSSSCRDRYTSDILVSGGFAAVLALGDNQYYCGGYSAFIQSYDLSWGRVKSSTRPAVGNHEYLTSGGTGCDASNAGAAGYFSYFGAAAGQQGQGYYSYDVGAWHLIALNSNCSSAGGCGTGSPQDTWLRADLAAHPNACTLAYWHIPLYSSGGRASINMQKLWQVLYDADADLVLAGHDHLYERFGPQNANAGLDAARGLRSFIVGTGGANHTSVTTVAANSELRNDSTFGILSLTLHSTSYDWQFIPEAGKTFTDSGNAACHGTSSTPDTSPPSTPTGLSAVASSSSSVALTWNASTDNQGVASYEILRNGSVIGTSSTTSWTDSGTSAATTYSYTVRALDFAGNRSAESTAAVVTTPSALQFAPVADAYIRQDPATANFGTAATIQTDGSPVKRSLLRFTVAGLGSGGVASAKLRLYCADPSSTGGQIRAVTGSWTETGVTWANSPVFGTSTVASIGAVSAGSWYEVDVTSLVTGNGDVTLGLVSSDSNGADFVSREGAAAQRPQLVVTPRP